MLNHDISAQVFNCFMRWKLSKFQRRLENPIQMAMYRLMNDRISIGGSSNWCNFFWHSLPELHIGFNEWTRWRTRSACAGGVACGISLCSGIGRSIPWRCCGRPGRVFSILMICRQLRAVNRFERSLTVIRRVAQRKLLTSGECRKIRDCCIFRVNGLEVSFWYFAGNE